MADPMAVDERMEEESENEKQKNVKKHIQTEKERARELFHQKEAEKQKAVAQKKLEECEEKLATLDALARTSFDEAMEKLFSLEKVYRLASEWELGSLVAQKVVRLCYELKEFQSLNDKIMVLQKKRQQHRIVVTNIVKEAISLLDSMPSLDHELQLIDTLREVTAGKIFVEVERARLTQRLANIKEKMGLPNEAADILQEVQVETHGSMENDEKTQFILEQMRLNLLRKDFPRVHIIAEKINMKVFDDPKFDVLERKFYEVMIQYYLHENDYLSIARAYHRLFTRSLALEKDDWVLLLQNLCVYCVLTEFGPEQQTLVNSVGSEKRLMQSELGPFQSLVKHFLRGEVISWKSLSQEFSPSFEILGLPSDLWKVLHTRCTQHSMRVIASCYSALSMSRFAQLLDLPEDEAETAFCDSVCSKDIFGRLNRPNGTISFAAPRSTSETLEDWTNQINAAITLIGDTTYAIEKEILGNRDLRSIR